MKIVELILDENEELSGVDAISVVENPAIEEDFVALKSQELKLAEVDKDKKILLGALLIPNKPIFRKGEEEDYYIYFSKNTVKKISENFLQKGNQNKTTLEHQQDASVKDLSKQETDDIVDAIKELFTHHVQLKTFNDYPQSVVNNAKRGIELNAKVNNKCATLVGKNRARQLASKEKLSVPTIKRLYSYLSRAETYYNPKDNEACGTISFLLWGGKSAKSWAESKLKSLGELKLYSEKVNDDFAIIMDRLAYSSKDMAEKIALDIGCDGIHEHDYEDQTWYMPCEKHAMSEEEFRKYKCPEGYVKDYKKHKCVKKDKYAKVGKRGGIVKSPKAPKSDTPNPNPKGKGTARGTAKGKTGAKVSARDRATLQKKADDFNKRYKEKLGYGVTVGMLSSVFQRGLGAFNVSHSPRVKSASQWSFARVNAFLYLIKNGRPQNAKYKQDNDLLPKKHPKSTK